MSLTRTNSRTSLNETAPTINTDDSSVDITSSISSTSTIETPDPGEKSKNKKPVMKLQIPAEENSPKIKDSNLSPRQIPKSPRLLKSKNSFLTKNTSPRNDLKSSSELTEKNAGNSLQSKLDVDFHPEASSNSEPILQVRRTKIVVPTMLLNQKEDEAITVTSSTPPNTSVSTSATSTPSVSTLTINTQQVVTVKAGPPSIEDCSRALLYLIFKKYEANALTSGAISAFGREDIFYPVKAIPIVLTHLTEFPDNGITSISELLIALFGDDFKNSYAWMQVKVFLQNGMYVDDGAVQFGETDPDVKQKYVERLKPYALNVAENILGKDKTINTSALAAGFLNLLFEGDMRLLNICMTSTKLSAKEMNDARLHFLFDMVVTRFAQVLVMNRFPERPSQVESWFSSTIIDALGEGIKSLSNDFLELSNNRMPADLKKKFFEKVEAETREDEAIKKFKLIELKKTRINELQKNERTRGHSRVNSHVTLVNVKLERNYKKLLDDIKEQCGFDDMGSDFLKFISHNQNISFDPAFKTNASNVILNLKLAVREYDEMKRSKGFQSDEKLKIVIKNLDILLEKEFNAKQKRRTTAFSKDINFTEKLRQTLVDTSIQNSVVTPSIHISSNTPPSENTSTSATTSTTVSSSQQHESGSAEKTDA